MNSLCNHGILILVCVRTTAKCLTYLSDMYDKWI